MAIKAFKTYDLPEPPEPYVNESAATALAQGSITQPIVVDDGVIRSGAYVKGTSGWALNSDGTIEAVNATIIGKVTATSGTIGGWEIATSTLTSGGVIFDAANQVLKFGQATAPLTGTGIFIGLSSSVYQFRAGNPSAEYIIWNGTSLSVSGTITTSNGSVGGFTIGADYFRDSANTFGLSSTITAGDDVRFWAGAAFANRATAPFRVTEAGAVNASNIVITGGSISGASLNIGTATEYLKYDSENGVQLKGTMTITNPEDINTSDLNNDAGWTDDTGLSNFISNTYATDIASLQNQLDGVVLTYFLEGEPTLSNEPAVDWTTNELKDEHLGDLYYNLTTGYAYRFIFDTTYQWFLVPDASAEALAAAAAAQDTADGKRRVFVATPTTPYNVGDLWLTSTSASTGDLKKCTTERLTGDYSASDWVIATKYTEGADWSTNLLNIPGVLGTPSGTGLFVSATHLGYYETSAWKTYMDSDGNFYLGGTSGKFQWTASTDTGIISGWTLNETTLSTLGIILDAGNQTISVGATNPILIDGLHKNIESDNYVSGAFGAGFHIDENFAEFGNASIRGIIRTSVFRKDEVSAVGGNLVVLDGDILDEDMTADD